jgi:hypothetical protein
MSSSQQEHDDTITRLGTEQKAFISPEEDLHSNLFGFHYVQVDASEKCLIYRDGILYKQLTPGPHHWWTGFFHKWKKQRINMRIELLPLTVKGRVKGPSMPKEVPGASAVDLACDVTTKLDLTCRMADIQTFLQYRSPISVFESAISNMVVEMIGKLSYDMYGQWAKELRNLIRERLMVAGHDNAERLVGIKIEDVYVKEFRPNTAHDQNMIANYQIVERIRREASIAQAKAEQDRLSAVSYREQAEILNIAPAILALQKTPIGIALIERDADLRKLVIGAGLNPGVNIYPIQDPNPQLSSGQGANIGYLHAPQSTTPPGQNPPPVVQPSGPISFGSQQSSQSGPIDFNTYAASSMNSSTQSFDMGDAPVDAERRKQELAAFGQSTFEPAGEGKIVPQHDEYGNVIPNTKEWVLQVSVQREYTALTIVFHCPAGYPIYPPAVQVRSARGQLQWIEPNSVRDWHMDRLLVEVAQEISNEIP